MSSRLLQRLEEQIAAPVGPALKLDCLRAERAGVLARSGRCAEARQALAGLHAQYAARPHVVMSAWLCWVDGLLCHFGSVGAEALDRMRRAYALSGAAREMKLHALSAAWLAQMEQVHDDLPQMVRHVGEALRLAPAHDHAARARASLVVAQGYHLGGQFERARPWYDKVRQHGNADGDEATLGALMHNMAWIHSSLARQQALAEAEVGSAAALDAAQLMLSADSTANFHQRAGLMSVDALLPMLRARIHSLQGEWQAALALYEAHLAAAVVQGLVCMRASLQADLAWCRWQAGDAAGALRESGVALDCLAAERDVDDMAAAHSCLARLFAASGDAEAQARHADAARHAWQVHRRHQADMVRLLDEALGDPVLA